MPITQERFLALLYAASDYKGGFENMTDFVTREYQHLCEKKRQGTIKLEDALNTLETIIQHARLGMWMAKPIEAEIIIRQEAKHFSPAKMRENKRRRQKEAERRRVLGVRPRTQDRSGFEEYVDVEMQRMVPPGGTAPQFTPGAALRMGTNAVMRAHEHLDEWYKDHPEDDPNSPEYNPDAGIDDTIPGIAERARRERETMTAPIPQDPEALPQLINDDGDTD